VKLRWDDGEGLETGNEDMDGISEGECSPGFRVHLRRGGPGGLIVSGTNLQRSQCHSKEDYNFRTNQTGGGTPTSRKEESRPEYKKDN